MPILILTDCATLPALYANPFDVITYIAMSLYLRFFHTLSGMYSCKRFCAAAFFPSEIPCPEPNAPRNGDFEYFSIAFYTKFYTPNGTFSSVGVTLENFHCSAILHLNISNFQNRDMYCDDNDTNYFYLYLTSSDNSE